jgi:heme-degrading monooxygenase HmoA
MHAVIFEVWPAEGHLDDYFDHVALLKQDLEKVDGFISVERFESLTEPGKLLSLSIWESEEAIRAWRNLPSHRRSQAAGRAGIFRNYRLRVATIDRDYGLNERTEAPGDSRSSHD